MKEVIYVVGKERVDYLLTNDEFKEAANFWQEKKDYWCQRLERFFTPYHLGAGSLSEDLGYDAIFLKSEKMSDGKTHMKKFWKKGNDFYYMGSSGKVQKCWKNQEDYDKFISDIVPEDEYYIRGLLSSDQYQTKRQLLLKGVETKQITK